ncbi:DegV family protein [Ligilactobacillus salitolerans]|uniref:DegV family protein n=1 Tax=Ligilactobacillus salitolerans TaxID=1808352 RepID=A0A401IWI6_9LACO|nr:DegV family protein [Ligilactobacillus salitolerans]GBG95865.1 DegV family protein [Ligilactobacillus salitolerans]
MSQAIKIVTDSSVLLTPNEIKENSLTIVPLSVEVGGKNYVDGENITRAELVEALKNGQIPKTSQPALGQFVDTFDKLGADGSEVIAILLSDVLSGTFDTAQKAAEMTDTKVTVINSKSTDRGLAFQVLAAAQDVRDGKNIAEIKEHCAEIYSRTSIEVLIDSLDCIVAGGRISKMTGLIAKLANIKVVVELHDKTLDVVSKGRSSKSLIRFVEKIADLHKSENNPIQALALPNVAADQSMLDKVKQILIGDRPDTPFIADLTSPIIITHTGLKAIGVITLASKPREQF